MAQALGAKLLDRHGKPLKPGGAALRELAHIDVYALDPRLKQATVIVACDARAQSTVRAARREFYFRAAKRRF